MRVSIAATWLTVTVLGMTALVLAVAALKLAVDNPEIDGTSRGNNYLCGAPYDTVLLRNENIPGGEPPTDSDSIATRCVRAGEARLTKCAALWAGAYLIACAAAGIAARARRRPVVMIDAVTEDVAPRDVRSDASSDVRRL